MSANVDARARTSPDVAGNGAEEMAQRAQADPQAFRALYQAFLPRVYRFAAAHTASAQDAEDVTSATFEKALRVLQGYDHRGPFDAWLFRIALNCLRDHARQTRRQAHDGLPADLDRQASNDTEGEVLRRIAAEDLRRQMAHLPAAQCQVVTMLLLGDLRPHEVARMLGKREGTVRYLLHRALRTLKERLAHD